MPVVFGGICPHPPVMIPEVGGRQAGEVSSSQQAMLKLGEELKESGANCLVMISPHAPVFQNAVAINMLPRLRGDLRQFGAPSVSCELENDLILAKEIAKQARSFDINIVELDDRAVRQYQAGRELDHGFIVPLYFLLKAGVSIPFVAVSMGFLPPDYLYAFGVAAQKAAGELGKKIAVLASGDLSHRLTIDAPAGYDPHGQKFDRAMVDLVGKADIEGILSLDEKFTEKAGECGLRPIIMLFGAFDRLRVDANVLSYEGPFGVGYMIAGLKPQGPEPGRAFMEKMQNREKRNLAERRAKESFLVRLARRTVENYCRTGRLEKYMEDIAPEFLKEAGTFVSLKKHGHLRGCIGTIIPQHSNVIEEVMNNAISASTRDPRFDPVSEDELDELAYSVDVLTEPEPVHGTEDLDPKKYGVIVRSGSRSGVLLPDLEGINTAEEQVSIAMQKAGLHPSEEVELYRFMVKRYS